MMDDKYLIFRLWFMFIEIGQTNPDKNRFVYYLYQNQLSYKIKYWNIEAIYEIDIRRN